MFEVVRRQKSTWQDKLTLLHGQLACVSPSSGLMVNNVAGGVINVASVFVSNNSIGNPTDLASGLPDNNSSLTELASCPFPNDNNGSGSSNLLNSGTILDNSNKYGKSILHCLLVGSSLMYQALRIITPPDYNNLNAGFLGQTRCSPTQNRSISSYSNGNNSSGGQDPML